MSRPFCVPTEQERSGEVMSKNGKGAVKQTLTHCQLCGWEVDKPCDSLSRLKKCKLQQRNKAQGGVAADFVRAVTRGGEAVTYVSVSEGELRALT